MSECGDEIIEKHGEVTRRDAEQLLLRAKNLANLRAARTGKTITDAMSEVQKELEAHDAMLSAVAQRNLAMAVSAKQEMKAYMSRFDTIGRGAMALQEGSSRDVKGARKSVDYQIKSINAKFFGRLAADLESAGVLREFRTNDLNREIYQEMGELRDGGNPGKSGSKAATKIAKIVDDLTNEMVSRQNRAGAFIGDLPGYITRQTHDITKIRDAGGDPTSSRASYIAWRDKTLPLIDPERTFLGADPEKFMRNVHEGLYTGVHGSPSDAQNTGAVGVRGDLASKMSSERVLHFKDADSAFQYNELFGTRDFRQQVISDILNRSRSIGLMENMGPTPEQTFTQAIREMQEESRGRDDSAKQVDSVNMHKILSAFHQLTGVNDIPANPTLARVSGNIATVAQMSKMGAVFLTKLFGDKAFLQSEMGFQGISHLKTLGAQVTGIAARSPEQMQMLRLMGVGMDGLMGNALSRYSPTGTVSSTVDRAQRAFFDLNFLNYWTDAHKRTAGELMAAHLGEHADLTHEQLPPELQKVLNLYDIGSKQWDQLRGTAWSTDAGQRYITPDKIDQIPGLDARGRDKLDTSLRTYFQDRVDYAVPTPGAAEKRLVTMDTKAGTPLGESIRLLALFKSFPVTIANKILTRDVYGNGANSVGQWLLNDHQGKFNLATMVAMATVGGYLGMSIRDAISGRTPRDLMTDGKMNWDTLNEAAIRGGGLGLMGDVMAHDYDKNYSSFLESAGGPVIGQADTVARMMTKAKHGDDFSREAGKLTIDNLPFANLFYIRPVLNYYVLWNLQEMMNPGTINRMQKAADQQHQKFWMNPQGN